jgi:hypothetical protein
LFILLACLAIAIAGMLVIRARSRRSTFGYRSTPGQGADRNRL